MPFGLPWARMGFVNSDIDAEGQIRPDAPPEQLYDLATDLRQRTNLAGKEPERLLAMRKRFLEVVGPAAGKPRKATE